MSRIFLVSLFVCFTWAADPAALITSLPGFDISSFNFSMYSGYVTIQPGRSLFYWFVESARDPTSDPVVLWLNGGPGCSSLDGFFSEHGPLHFSDSGDLYHNQYSWNNVANVLYLESPAGVGFSYSADGSVVLNDTETAENAYAFLLGFFGSYSEYLDNDFYVSGESYAGHYVPQLTYQIHVGNNKGSQPQINLKGFLVGNGVTDNWYDGNSYLPFLYSHAFVSETEYDAANEACFGDYVDNNATGCLAALDIVYNNMNNINPYNIYEDCITSPNKKRDARNLRPHPLFPQAQIPCIDSTVETDYLNNPDVITAIHANPKITWQVCNLQLNENYLRDDTVLPIWSLLLKYYRAIVFSGDVDSSVNYQGTRAWVNALGLNLQVAWQQWHIIGELDQLQVAGFVKVYDQLTWLTVRGAGHMVPQYKPQAALRFFSLWLENQPIS